MIAASNVETSAVELFPFPCPSAPEQQPPRLRGPAVPVAALLYQEYSDCLLAASDTILFAWSWKRGEFWRVPVAEPSPLRSLQGSVVFDTPQGRKRAMSVRSLSSPAFTPPPRSAPPSRRPGRPAKENVGLLAPQNTATFGEKDAYSPSPVKDSAPSQKPLTPEVYDSPDELRTPEQRPRSSVEEVRTPPADFEPTLDPGVGQHPVSSNLDRAAAAADEQAAEECPRRELAWTLGPYPMALPEEGRRPEARSDRPRGIGRSRSLVSPKIGGGDFSDVVHSTQRIRDDTAARARSIHQRQVFDSVGLLLSGQEQPITSTLVVPQGVYREATAGRFLCRSRDTGTLCEVEVQLPGGRLLRVLRNALRRSLTFEGEVVSRWAFGGRAVPAEEERLGERLVVQLPATFDLAEPPERVERAFEEGRCLVAVRRRRHSAGADGAGAGAAGCIGAGAPAAGIPGAQDGASGGVGRCLGGFGRGQNVTHADCEL